MGMPTFQQIGRCPACEGPIVIPVHLLNVILPYIRYVCNCGAKFDLCENKSVDTKQEEPEELLWAV